MDWPLVYLLHLSLIHILEQEMQIPVKLFEGSYCNIKITTPEDLETAKGFIEHQ